MLRVTRRIALPLICLLPCACTNQENGSASAPAPNPVPLASEMLATFAGGCFWCMEPPFEKERGVRSVISGYTGGAEKDPTYEQVSRGLTSHTEAVQVVYDPNLVTYRRLLAIFWRSMDPTDAGGQFADRGSQYRPAIFAHDAEQKAAATESRTALAASKVFPKPIVVPVEDYTVFYPAEEYHQDYYKKNASHYERYRRGSGREGFLLRVWGGEPTPDPPGKATSRPSSK